MSQTVESTRTRYNLRSAETCTGLEWTVRELEEWRNFGWETGLRTAAQMELR